MAIDKKEELVEADDFRQVKTKYVDEDSEDISENAEPDITEIPKKFKLENIIGKLHLSNFSCTEDKFVFDWDYVERWTSPPNKKKFLGGVRASVKESDPGLSDMFLVLWNRGKGTLEFDIDEEKVKEGRLVFEDWFSRMNDRDIKANKSRFYFILAGVDRTGAKVGYILGGDKDLNGLFSDKTRIDHLKKEIIDYFPRRHYLGEREEDYWFLNFVNNYNYIENVRNDGLLNELLVKIDGVDWQDDKILIKISDGQKKLAPAFKHIDRVFFDYKAQRIYYKEDIYYDKEKNTFVLNNSLIDRIKSVYDERGNRFTFELNPVGFDDGKAYFIKFFSKRRKRRLTKYNKLDKYESVRILNREADACTEETREGEVQTKPCDLAIMPNYTNGRELRIFIKDASKSVNEYARGRVTYFGINKGMLLLNFEYPKMPYHLNTLKFCLRSDVIDRSYDFDVKETISGSRVKVKARLDLSKVEWEQFYWDIKATVLGEDGREYELLLRNYNKTMKLKMLLKDTQYILPGEEYLVFSYLTNSSGFAVTYRLKTPQDCKAFIYKEYLALFIYYILAPYWNLRNIWLVYEKYSITAQDNSLYFFKYCMEKIPEKEKKHIYYVIDKNAPDYQYVEQYGKKVIQFLSLKHMIYLKASKMLISSDTKAHAYAWHSPNSLYRYMIKWKRNVFLQHGVIYYKQCHRGLRKNGTNNCRLFIVSSEVEKQIIRDYFGYKANQIAVTGLARWDVLEDTSVPGEKLILVMPTWRSWLEEATLETFRESDYYKNYMRLLNYPRLHRFLEEKNVKLIFYIHPKFREYIGAFSVDSPYIEMIEFGTKPLNQILMKCNMMITDYSSACWDVYYQGKPVLFYIFDFELYNQTNGSYVDMRKDAFGEATDNMDELIDLIEKYEANGFTEEEKYAKLRDKLLPYRDDKNSERTYNRIMQKFYFKKYLRYAKKGIIEVDEETLADMLKRKRK